MTENQRFLIKGQYIKDLSFENPGAPNSLIALKEPPKIDVNVNLRGEKLRERYFELVMQITVKAQGAEGSLFLIDLSYAGIFEFIGVADENVSPVLLIDCPFVLFPFARRVIADVSRDGGFPPLMLEPIDFHGLYMRNQSEAQAAAN